MEINVIKAKLDYKSFESKKLRVAAYVRVSSKNEIQMSSFNSQLLYYENKIKENPNWSFVKIYSDNGISGRNVLNRCGFIELIKDSFSNKIDFILTKSISRFARNTSDLLALTRKLKSMNVGIYFEEESINTLNMDSEFLLSVLASVAQQESENTSEHIKKGIEFIVKKGEARIIKKIYGYNVDKINKTYLINETEANVVKDIFNMYLNDIDPYEIAIILNTKGINANSKSGLWKRNNVNGILNNRSYIGEYVQELNRPSRTLKTQKKNISKLYIIKDHHEAIIDRETWDIVKNKKKSKSPIKHEQLFLYNKCFDNRIRCGFCGGICGKIWKYDKTIWRCCKIKGGRCSYSKKIYENDLENIFIEMINYIYKNYDENFKKDLKKLKDDNSINYKNYNDISSDLSYLINRYLNKKISFGDYYHEEQILKDKINLLHRKIEKVEQQINKLINNRNIIFEYIDLSFTDNLKIFNESLFNTMIKFIILGGYSDKGTKNPFLVRFILREQNVFSFMEEYGIIDKNKIISNSNNYELLLCFKSKIRIRCLGVNQRNKKENKILYKHPIITLELEK